MDRGKHENKLVILGRLYDTYRLLKFRSKLDIKKLFVDFRYKMNKITVIIMN